MAVTKKAEEPELTPAEIEKLPVRLFNVLTMHNFYVLAKDHDDARAAATAIIASGDQKPYEQVAYETTRERNINSAWRDQAPWLSANIPDQPEETTLEAFQRIYSKRG